MSSSSDTPQSTGRPTESTSPEDSAAADAAGTSAPEDVKRKFREALDRKHAHGGRDVSAGGAAGKAQDAHGPASTQRTFRRKSGG